MPDACPFDTEVILDALGAALDHLRADEPDEARRLLENVAGALQLDGGPEDLN